MSSYFAFVGAINWATSIAHKYTATLKLTSYSSVVTSIAAPTVKGGLTTTAGSSATANYDANGNVFNFTYDQDRVEVTSVSLLNASGNTVDKTSDCTIDSNGKCTLFDVGTYTFTFKIKDTCGAVWNSTTNDQNPKAVLVTINSVKLNVPQDVSTDYNGDPQSLKSLANKPNWYVQSVYTNNNVMSLSAETFTDADDYNVTATIVSSGHIWSDNSTGAKSFKFKVNKKLLSINWTEGTNGYKVAQFADVNEIYSRDSGDKYPQLVTKYYEKGDSATNLQTSPTGLGDWYAVAVLENAETCNYCVNAEQQFSVSKTQIAHPVLSTSNNLPYNGNSQEFTFNGFDSDLMDFVVPDGVDSFNGEKLYATNAGDYTPVYTLKNTSLYEWADDAPGAVTITPKTIAVAFTGEKKTEWEKGEAVSFTLSAAALEGESVQLAATYQRGSGTPFALSVTDNGDGTHTVTIPATAARGNYTLTVNVADSCKNYAAVKEATHSFEITAQGLALQEDELEWLIGGKRYTVADLNAEGFIEIEYTGAPVVPTVDDSTFVDFSIDGYGGDSSAVTVGTYQRTVHIVANSEEYAFDQTFTLNYKIVAKVLDFSGAVWEYSSDDGATWTEMTATNKPSYTGDAITVRVSPDFYAGLGLAAADYSENYNNTNISTEQGTKTTEVYVTVKNPNYTTANGNISSVQLIWEITARALTYKWDDNAQQVEVGENTFVIPAIKFDDDGDYSGYYECVYTVNGTEYTLEGLKAYIAENWSITTPVSGTVNVRMKDGVTEVNIASGTYPFSTGAPKTAIKVAVTGSGAEYGLVDFALSVTKGMADESARTTVSVSGETLAQAKSFDGNAPELAAFVNGLSVGKYTITVSLKAGNENSYVLTDSVFDFEIVTRKIVVPQVKGDIVFNGDYINVVDYLDSNYNASIMSMLSGYSNKTAGSYTVTFKLNNNNYIWVEPASADPMNKLLAKAVLFADGISIDNSALTANLGWTINKITLATDGWILSGKDGASLNALTAYQDMITANGLDVALAYRYYDTNGNLLEEPVLKGGEKYIVEAYLTGADAANFEFADGTDELKSVSARRDYTVPQSAVAAFFGSALNFAKANWLWLVIAAVVLLFLIILICLIVAAKKKKRKKEALAEQRRLEKEERDREERRQEREERMARMSQQQMMMPQMIPQGMAQAGGQPMGMGGGSIGGGSSNEIAELKAEMAAMRTEATLRAEMAAKESAEIKAQRAAEQQVTNLLARLGGEQVISNGITLDKLTEIVEKTVERVLERKEKSATATASDGAAATQVPPDAVMTTVTTTKIDTTKKPVQSAPSAAAPSAPAGRSIVRNFVAPMPVDDGRVFDVGGFYTPVDPITDDIENLLDDDKD